MDLVSQIQILNQICVLLHVNVLAKDIWICSSPAVKQYKRLGSPALVGQQLQEKENSKFKSKILPLWKGLVSAEASSP